MAKSSIEWTESTWNPVTGCTKTSPGCKNCYAERMAIRLHAMGQENYRNGFNVALHPHVLEYPLKWTKSQMIFVNSMSDLFHPSVPDEFIFEIFKVMNKANWHIFQVLTKRAERLKVLNNKLEWAPNIWMGVSVENSDYKYRISYLRKTGARIKFISLEPLINSVGQMNLNNIDWVIVGGESGPKARYMDKAWVIEIKEQCIQTGVKFFFKQWGGFNKKKNGRILNGKTWDQVPELVMV